MLDEKANIFKVRYLSGKHYRKCGRHKREGGSALPGEILLHAPVLPLSRDCGMWSKKSAEAILAFIDQR
jgi:hypothetical protein